MTDGETGTEFRLAYAPGVTPAKWVNVWTERIPDIPLTLTTAPAADLVPLLREGAADAAFVRLPIDRDGLSVIPLYVETTVVVVPKDHAIAAVDELTLADLADEDIFHPLDDTLEWPSFPGHPAFTRPPTTANAIELVASGTGLLLVPQSLGRLHHRRDLTYRPVQDAPQSQIALAWPAEATTDQVEDFIGIVRGRTPNSSRGRTQPTPKTNTKTPKPQQATRKPTPRRTPPPRHNRKGRQGR
ncbi:LysR family substrate-binding domain-containing protein [Nonomuraea fuscirosea]|uniref:LysR family substrate-binding domain-containing protein n=1 Tax=Nonomuraea fuscirosea TaxID=1291556 RepID=UPI002DD80A53|nr:LysR family substrate-binding domain-containing protein [Nonomuraea fuscirosea]WSA54328.1 LysR family substrate-binding domain-containing protein [Nonomuraea fuscirosea]